MDLVFFENYESGDFDWDELSGVLQMESEGVQRFLRDLLPDSFNDIMAAIANTIYT